jgi:hypothetical protein
MEFVPSTRKHTVVLKNIKNAAMLSYVIVKVNKCSSLVLWKTKKMILKQ